MHHCCGRANPLVLIRARTYTNIVSRSSSCFCFCCCCFLHSCSVRFLACVAIVYIWLGDENAHHFPLNRNIKTRKSLWHHHRRRHRQYHRLWFWHIEMENAAIGHTFIESLVPSIINKTSKLLFARNLYAFILHNASHPGDSHSPSSCTP